MIGKFWIPGMILLLALSGWAAQEAAGPVGGAKAPNTPAETASAQQKDTTQIQPATGTTLLDLFIDSLRDMAQRGTPEDIEKRLQEVMIAANKAREAKAIDPVFFLRFNRMLAVTKLVIVPDPGGILAPVIEVVLGAFVQDMTGRSFREGKGPEAVNMVANALAQEIINLQIYLDTLDRRQALQKKIDEKMSRSPVK
jgi:hypothetical protein